MWKRIIGLIVGVLMAAGGTATRVAAEATNAPPAAKARHGARRSHALAFRGTVKAVDKVAMTLTIAGKKRERVVQITSRTRLFKNGKPAVLEDAAVGEAVTGRARQVAEGKWEATLVRLGTSTRAPRRPRKAKPAPAESP